jgi:hypothetical protein
MMVFNDETTKGKKMNLNEMTVPELRKIAAQFKITGRSTMKKAELIDALNAPEIASLVELSLSISETAEIEADADTMEAIAETEAEDTSVKAIVTRDAPGTAYVNLDTTKANVAVIVRKGRRWELQTATGETMTIRAGSIAKVVKAWAKRLGIMLDNIETVKQF